MPRNQPRTSSRSRQSTQPAPVPVQEDSLDEPESPSPTKSRRRSPRILDTFRPTPSGAAARVTRSLTRGSKSEPESRDADSDEEEESESEPEVTRKRSRSGKKRGAPRKRGRASKGSPGKGGKKKGRPTRRTRKQDSEDEESEESLDLGESEEEEKVVDDEEEEDSKVETAPTPRRGNRGGTRSSVGTSNASPGSKGSPSVVLERVENVAPISGRPARGRSVKQRNEAEIEEEAAEGEEQQQTPASKRTSTRARRGRASQQPAAAAAAAAKKTRQQPAKSGKMVPSEENAAALTTTTTTDTVAKEEKDEKEIPLKEKTEKKAGDQEESKDEDEEKMEVDEPLVQSTDEISEVDSESGAEKEKPTKHKLEEGKDKGAAESAPAQKKAKTEDEDEEDDDEIEEVESKTEDKETKDSTDTTEPEAKKDAAESTPKADKDETAADKTENNSTFQDCDKKESAEERATPTANVTNGEEGDKKSEVSAAAPVEPRINGSTSDDGVTTNDEEHKTTDNGCELESSIIFASLGVKVPRRCVPNSDLNDKAGKDPFTVVSFNLAEEDWTAKHQNLVNEVLQLSPSILCLQEIDEVYFKSSLDSSLKSHGYMGLYKAGKTSTKGLATFYLLSTFEILHHREFEVHELLEKDVEGTNLVDTEKEALKTFLHSPAPVLITKLKSVSNGKTVTVGTVHLPSEDESVLAVQVAAVLREIHNINDGANNPHVLCGSFNLADDSIVYQLLRDGILKNEILDELKKNANVPVPEKENASLVKLLETCLQHPSASLKSSYGSILGHELKFPDKAQKLSKDSLWFSSDSLLTKSILDVGPIAEKTLPNTHISLKAELGFVN